MALNRPVSMF